jgi:hypothetical protein
MEAIDKISRTRRCAVAGSIDHDPSRRLTLAGTAGIERGGGNGDAVARARVRGRREVSEASAQSVRPSHLVRLDQVGRRRWVGQADRKGGKVLNQF